MVAASFSQSISFTVRWEIFTLVISESIENSLEMSCDVARGLLIRKIAGITGFIG